MPLTDAVPRTVRAVRPLVIAAGAALLSACCGHFFYTCAPLQPAAITANENVQTFLSARDQASGLLASANRILNADAVARVTPRYTTAAAAANTWIDAAQSALRGQGSYDIADSSRQLDTVVADVRAFADAVESEVAAGNMKVAFTPPPNEAVLDQLTASPPIVAGAEYVANGVAQGVAAIKAAQTPVSELDSSQRAVIADTIASAKWPAASQVVSRAIAQRR
ncbi:MAG: hypothetical protein JO043_13325 [Candidatus Eremiobacteraeota bacterium]|nr:hypothetical protein [Candidatus Eremiobacteraeota bacterium]